MRLLIQELPDCDFVVIGSAYEHNFSLSVNATVSQNGWNNVHNFIEKASLSESAALIESCDAFIGTDSGPMHIADALDMPMVALMSSKNYIEIWQPVSANARVLNHPISCGPCFLAECPRHNECMAMITPEEVITALRRVIGHKRSMSAGEISPQ